MVGRRAWEFELALTQTEPTRVLKPDVFQEFELSSKTVIAPRVAIYRFNLPRPSDILGLPIGQHVAIMANIHGKNIMRSYTPTSSDADLGHFTLLIKSYPNGNMSRHIGELRPGDKIRMRGPKGQFVYMPNMVRAFGMIAGGTGITPIFQIFQAIARNPYDRTQVDLIYANISAHDILLKPDLDRLAASHPNIRVHYVLNKPPAGWTGAVGFVTQDLIQKLCPAPAPDVKILMCGPPPMISAMKRATTALGFEPAKTVSKLRDQVFIF